MTRPAAAWGRLRHAGWRAWSKTGHDNQRVSPHDQRVSVATGTRPIFARAAHRISACRGDGAAERASGLPVTPGTGSRAISTAGRGTLQPLRSNNAMPFNTPGRVDQAGA